MPRAEEEAVRQDRELIRVRPALRYFAWATVQRRQAIDVPCDLLKLNCISWNSI
jgi:hypothetical protein